MASHAVRSPQRAFCCSQGTPRESRRNLLIDPEALPDFGHPREKVVNFFCKPSITGAKLFQPFDP
jgi:hypothetical protein